MMDPSPEAVIVYFSDVTTEKMSDLCAGSMVRQSIGDSIGVKIHTILDAIRRYVCVTLDDN